MTEKNEDAPSLESISNQEEKGSVSQNDEEPAVDPENPQEDSSKNNSASQGIESDSGQRILTPIVTDGVDPLDAEPEYNIPFLRLY
ncbi:hypothetical protein TVAG_491620 [Trichomonas vaginalis G3]|uniref:Uncharacterized protein n=1 Tax=Trichomonas vaginalis (strain ATCC PRA-98 / G3) TaxID=412133 RepID=A2EAJ4_TRIV3|nr:hypothetical protein TVAGG3_1004280 [Trichomonas vaginalis G3]EAY10305.1 hypothetical protein TVAG_491620 [Trichomonas vaginalis G3]KAI5491022.1 hypothetical protein TVAGG3_1004280 [Trichomonas vaginalis G3]|eukprot:XP_001322528.1 hypothetical protein [Trichomonas vaginalis G3]